MKNSNFDWNSHHYLLVALSAGIVYSNVLKAEFLYDDRPAILSNDDVLGRTRWHSMVTTNDFWGNPIRLEGSHKSYRPLITASFRLQFAIHGLKADLFHGVNLICHVINSILVLKLGKQLKIMDLSLFSALLFACHPITSEAVCSIVGRADLMNTMFILLAITFHIESPNTLRTSLFSILAILSKETGIVLLPLIVLYEVLFKDRSTKKFKTDITSYLMFVSMISYLRLSISNYQTPIFSRNDNPISHEGSFLTRTLTFLFLPIFHLFLIVFPKNLSFDWSMDAIPKVESVMDSRFVLSIIIYVTGLKVIGWLMMNTNEKNRKLLFLIGMFVTPHIVSSNLITYVGFVVAERILYLNTVSYCILIGFAIGILRKKYPILSSSTCYPILVLLLSVCCFRTIQRVEDWKTEESLFKSALHVNPTKAHLNLGYVFTTQKKYEKARYHYEQALKRNGRLADAWYNLGTLTSHSQNSTRMAIQFYQNALQSRKNFAAAHLNIALLLHDEGFHQKAFFHLEQCLQNPGTDLKLYRNHQKTRATCAYNKGRLLQKSSRIQEAIDSFSLALNIGGPFFEHIPSVLNSIGLCFNELGDVESAEKYFEMAIRENHVNSFLTMAHLKIRQNRSYEVGGLLQKVMRLAPDSVTVLQNIALAEFQMKNYNRSLVFYRKALGVDPNHLDSLYGIAHLLQETRRYSVAEEFFQKIQQLQPESYSAHSNYGAILHLNQKYDEALNAYDKALILNSNDTITRENRQKLMRILKKKRKI
uniref:dolichyl-phosphate-mannose--protein mannosyltransferase n=1 Tax=Caenorhabditis tropicalis TaxID=1561998 RepID=A0A1I7T622_9PELO